MVLSRLAVEKLITILQTGNFAVCVKKSKKEKLVTPSKVTRTDQNGSGY